MKVLMVHELWHRIPISRRRWAFGVFGVLVPVLIFRIFDLSVFAASSYYVSPSGNDSNPGTINAPWKTLTYAGGQLAAGDTLYVRGGTYNEKVNFRHSGTASQPIKILAYS